MELLVLIDQGIGLIKGISVRVGKNRCVDYAERWEWGDSPRSGSVLFGKL
jgi:hypothetical protein